jgi:6-phosphogluconolactonase
MGLFGTVRVVDDVAVAFAELMVERAPSSVALSGGETARRCYELLVTASFDWSATSVWFGDERWVPLDHPDSNEGMARVALLDAVDPLVIHSMRHATPGTEVTPGDAAAPYGRLLRDHEPLDLVHLGLGPDGHTASLFPGSPAVEEDHHRVVATGDDVHPHPRLTFTLPGIAPSRLAVFTVAGADKRDAWAHVRVDDTLPAARVRAHEVIWLVDHAATGTESAPRGA